VEFSHILTIGNLARVDQIGTSAPVTRFRFGILVGNGVIFDENRRVINDAHDIQDVLEQFEVIYRPKDKRKRPVREHRFSSGRQKYMACGLTFRPYCHVSLKKILTKKRSLIMDDRE
jgi:hypothetical protein